jgi:hypothetical protein
MYKMKKRGNALALKLLAALSAVLLSAFFFSACAGSPAQPADTAEPGGNGNGDSIVSVIINQIYGRGFEGSNLGDTAGSHSFVELYNAGAGEADLAGYVLYAGANGVDENGNPWSAWNSALELEGKIPAKHSFLVAVTANSAPIQTPNLVITDYDLAWPGSAFLQSARVGLSNKNLKVFLRKGTAAVTVKNPFDTDGAGSKLDGYVDMLSVTGNDSPVPADAFEGAGAAVGQSKQKAARRIMLTDTDEGAADVKIIDYRAKAAGGVTDGELAIYRPRTLKDGAWSGAEGADPQPAQGLIINQIMGIGNKSDDGQAASHSFAELYNASNAAIDLSGYTLQAAGNGADWAVLELSGTILPGHSYLVALTDHTNAGARLSLSVWDMEWSGAAFPNKGLKVVLLSVKEPLTAANPFNIDGNGTKAAGYVDMIGVAGNDAGSVIDGCETAYLAEQSKQKSIRRIAFQDTDDNSADVQVVDFRDAELAAYRPRSAADGVWGV